MDRINLLFYYMGQTRPLLFFSTSSQHNDRYRTKFEYKQKKLVCMGFDPGTSGWLAETNPPIFAGPAPFYEHALLAKYDFR